MFFFRIKMSISNFFLRLSMRKKLLRGTAVVAIAALMLTVAFFSSREWIMAHVNWQFALHRHRNLTMADFQYDFEHLMRVLEEDWPFFELSISANGVDVHQLADEFRHTLASADVDAIGFLSCCARIFSAPLGNLGICGQLTIRCFLTDCMAALHGKHWRWLSLVNLRLIRVI